MTMEMTSPLDWQTMFSDPSGCRQHKPRTIGKTMVIDKGLGLNAFEDMLITSSAHIDVIKLGFGTSPLYPASVLQKKLRLAQQYDIEIMPGGTFLEIAVMQQASSHFIDVIKQLGFSAIEVSDGTIEISRKRKSELIQEAVQRGLKVYTEYGKKIWGSRIDSNELSETVEIDISCGAELVTIEGRESGTGVGIYDASGQARDEDILEVINKIGNRDVLLWETPLKNQQVQLIKLLGTNVNLGNISPADVMSVEALRRGLRSDTMNIAPVF